ncbi:DNA glycosylase [Pelagophyceae sp. CCMP2097]|nr:DNA glycosylase [Pelagophyceae sp. CCMP2097]
MASRCKVEDDVEAPERRSARSGSKAQVVKVEDVKVRKGDAVLTRRAARSEPAPKRPKKEAPSKLTEAAACSGPAPKRPKKEAPSELAPAAACSPFESWAAPSPEACELAVSALTALHGAVLPQAPRSVVDSLVRTILSQNTTDKTSQVAFDRLKAALPDWRDVLAAPDGVAEEAVRCGGLAEIKMERIRAILRDPRCAAEGGEPSLEWLRGRNDVEVKKVLSSFNGVGPKTVACVMMFTLGRAEFPVDTHVLFIAKRLGWLPERATREQAHSHLNVRVPDQSKLSLHVLLVDHGKSCKSCAKNGRLQKKPDGEAPPCPLRVHHSGKTL